MASTKAKNNCVSQCLLMVHNIILLVFKNSKEGLPPHTQKNEKQVIRYITSLPKQHKTWTFMAYQILCKKQKKSGLQIWSSIADFFFFYYFSERWVSIALLTIPPPCPPNQKEKKIKINRKTGGKNYQKKKSDNCYRSFLYLNLELQFAVEHAINKELLQQQR